MGKKEENTEIQKHEHLENESFFDEKAFFIIIEGLSFGEKMKHNITTKLQKIGFILNSCKVNIPEMLYSPFIRVW